MDTHKQVQQQTKPKLYFSPFSYWPNSTLFPFLGKILKLVGVSDCMCELGLNSSSWVLKDSKVRSIYPIPFFSFSPFLIFNPKTPLLHLMWLHVCLISCLLLWERTEVSWVPWKDEKLEKNHRATVIYSDTLA
jgi:hypothetical protein